ncbi:MAG TPA: type II toxin-antitoxin system RelE/ParE family toxin [Epsilonproteobacteria bacterium]|nr:type II toxin-antitoxin system RelE/ParE family toxin [Campylobacterota bacterium]
MKIIESEQFKDELRTIAFYIKKDKVSASIDFVKNLKKRIKNLTEFPYQYKQSIYFENEEMRDMVYMGYTIVYEIDTEKNRLVLLSIFNQNLPDL